MPQAALATLAALLLAAALPAAAEAPASWRVDPAASAIAFGYVLNGEAASGAFRKVEGEGTFDPARPEATRLELRIDPRGLDLGDPLASAFAQGPEWFDSANHPVVRYRLVRLTPAPDGRWIALGDVTIKERLVIVETAVALTLSADGAAAAGSVAFDRRAFDLGTGLSALFVTVGHEVTVSFDLVARPEENP